ncbi:MAG: prephenate dehydratase [Planctomycetota bacterium]|jgi:prephenate dehydratase
MSIDLLPVSFCGAPGAFSEEAARRYFGESCATLTAASLEAAFVDVEEGRSRAAIVAVENSITGCFTGFADALGGRNLEIAGEVVLSVRHCLMAVPGARLEGLTEVVSHPSALGQCRDWLTRAGLAQSSSPDTAAAAQDLVATGDRGRAVLGSRVLAKMYGLAVLAEGLSDHAENVTRFFVLSLPQEPSMDAAPTSSRSAVLIGPVEEPRALRNLRIGLESLDATRVRAPFMGTRDGLNFVIEFDHPNQRGDEIVKAVLDKSPYRMLGSWSAKEAG